MLDRRSFLGALALAGGGAVVGRAVARRGVEEEVLAARFHADHILGAGEATERWYRYRFVGQPVMDSQLLFVLGNAAAGLTDVGEVLDTATRIVPGDEVSWFEAWCATADRVRGDGEEAERRGHRLSAGSHLLRAGAYLRAGLLRYADHADPRVAEATRTTLALHDRALIHLGYESEAVEIPYEGSFLYGRLHWSPGAGRRPFLVLHQGLHAWTEDTHWVIDGALRRGYHVLAFHGPGQGASLRLKGHAFRPDWENVVGPVLDFAEGYERLDMGRAVLMGLSFGGFLAPRAAALEPRLHALVADPGVLDWGGTMLRHFHEIPGLMPLHASGPAAFDGAIAAISQAMPDARWYFADATWKHGVATPHALVTELQRYQNHDGVGRIRCRTLILDGAAEDATPGQSQALYDALQCPKHLIFFDHGSAAQTHCQGGATQLAQGRLFDWLDEVVAG